MLAALGGALGFLNCLLDSPLDLVDLACNLFLGFHNRFVRELVFRIIRPNVIVDPARVGTRELCTFRTYESNKNSIICLLGVAVWACWPSAHARPVGLRETPRKHIIEFLFKSELVCDWCSKSCYIVVMFLGGAVIAAVAVRAARDVAEEVGVAG